MATSDYRISTLPANVEAERSILGAILLDNLAYNEAAEHLKPEDFSLDSHRRIYSRMVDLAESSRPIDMITLVEELDRHKELEAIGDVATSPDWWTASPTGRASSTTSRSSATRRCCAG